ncbi:hypothetical protein NXS19_014090 [Fusarium pseudograminearum]|nr:hypothetical protein NXS19_014090 [Fusarium pseudograminearum]
MSVPPAVSIALLLLTLFIVFVGIAFAVKTTLPSPTLEIQSKELPSTSEAPKYNRNGLTNSSPGLFPFIEPFKMLSNLCPTLFLCKRCPQELPNPYI